MLLTHDGEVWLGDGRAYFFELVRENLDFFFVFIFFFRVL